MSLAVFERRMASSQRTAAFAQTLGARIRRLRRSRELTLERIAAALGVTRQMVSAYERGNVLLPSDRISALCETLAITPNELFDRTCDHAKN
jgi:transcriptional regulator with XRE-family HTH domain